VANCIFAFQYREGSVAKLYPISAQSATENVIPSYSLPSPVREDVAFQDEQLRRQLLWLKESWLWLLETKVLASKSPGTPRLKALEVGCGPGYVMELLANHFDVAGVDRDEGMVQKAHNRGLKVIQADAYDLPCENDSFDLVYCSFLMLWLKDPIKAISEMKRVAKHWVICLAEPDYGGRIDYPDELRSLTGCLAKEIIELGGDPYVGRKLRSFFIQNGMEGEVGVHQGVWSHDTLRNQSDQEWAIIEKAAEPNIDSVTLRRGRAVWEEALKNGSLFQFNPVFYALGRKV
jgi:SAM-dependent methyltransferase